MERLLENKVCVVTGAAQGIGKAIAMQMAKDGAIVYATDVQEGTMNQWAEEMMEKYATRIVPVYFDVCDSAAVKKELMAIHKKEGKIDCLVNNAAIISNRKIGMIMKEEVEKMFAVNVVALIDIMQVCSKLMSRTGGGSIVNMASVTAVVGSPGQVAYSATKGAVISLTKSAAKELAPANIRVNAVAPGIIKTERFEELYEASAEKIDERIAKIAIGRLGTPEDVANVCAFVASDRASYISGQVIGVDGCATI